MAQTARKAGPLEAFFHYRERGGTLGGEIGAGLVMAVLTICGIFMNMQLICSLNVTPYFESSTFEVTNNGEILASFYLISMLVCCAGTLLVGLISRLPLVQVTSISLSVVLVSIVGTSTGLTYYNLLFVTFVSAIAFTVVAVVPPLRRFVLDALPSPVRRALPAAMGLLLAWTAAQLTGLFNVGDSSMPIYGTNSIVGGSQYVQVSLVDTLSDFSFKVDPHHPMLLLSALAVIVCVVVYLFVRIRARHPILVALVVATIFFLAASFLQTNVNWKLMKVILDTLWARAWMVGAEDAMQYHLSTAFSLIGFGTVITEGSDFTAYVEAGGNVAMLIGSGAVTFVFLNLYGSIGATDACANERGRLAEAVDKGTGVVLVANAAINVVAPLVGVSPVAIGAESVAGVKDRGRSGLSSVVAAVVIGASAFVWVVPAIFMTVGSYVITLNLYGHYGKVLQLLTQCSFTVADAVMMVVGLSMVVHALDVDTKSVPDTAPFVTTIAATLLTSNLACGVAAGTVVFVLVSILPRRSKKGAKAAGPKLVERCGNVPTLVLALVSLAVLVLALV